MRRQARVSGAPARDVTPEGPVRPGPGRYRTPQVARAASCPASRPAHRPRRRCPDGDTAESPRTPSRHARPSPALTPTRRPHRAAVTHGEVSYPPPTSDALTKLPLAPGAARIFPTSPPHAPPTLHASAHAEPLPHSSLAPPPDLSSAHIPRRPSAAAQGAPTLQLPRRPSGDLEHPPTHHTKQGPRGPHISTQRARSAPESASAPYPAQDPDVSRRHRPGAASTGPPAPGRSLLTSAPALTRGPWVWRCDFAARRPGWPWGVRARQPGRPAARQEGGWAAAPPPRAGAQVASRGGLLSSPLALAALALPLASRSPAAGGGGAQERWERAARGSGPGRTPAGPAWCPRVPRGNAIPSAQEERPGGRRAGGEGEREREEKSSRAAWLRSLAAPGSRWAVRAPTAPPGGPRAPRPSACGRGPLRWDPRTAREDCSALRSGASSVEPGPHPHPAASPHLCPPLYSLRNIFDFKTPLASCKKTSFTRHLAPC
uniref:proteoglycan 4-like n=1 Tax=Callithrix jacchus TaxID=9483 RepID=UPI00159E6BCA|nr:proteoglycan 4-like [Callithrix jacchus]XP_054111646.1 proteoglycan 4-like [Callithrix jacchus]